MQQTAGFYITNIPANQFDAVVAEINRYFDLIESKPPYFEEWRTGLCLFENQGGIRMLSDVHADYFAYEVILPGLIEHLAKSVPNAPMRGDYSLSNDDSWRDECHNFEIAENGQLIWIHDDCGDFDEGIEDEMFEAALMSVWGDSGWSTLCENTFGELSEDGITAVFNICASILFEDQPIEEVYEELGVENNTPNMDDLADIISQCNDAIGCPNTHSYISYLLNKFASHGIDVAFPNELQNVLEEMC